MSNVIEIRALDSSATRSVVEASKQISIYIVEKNIFSDDQHEFVERMGRKI